MIRRIVSQKWLLGAGALWLVVAAAGVWFFMPIYLWVCDDCGISPDGGAFSPGESRIVWGSTIIAAAIAATIVTLAVIGPIVLVRRWLGVRSRA